MSNLFAQNSNKPNIILCMTDDMGWGDVAYNGHKVIKTPNLDNMAGSGLRFDRFYSAAPVCSPTRGSSLTGRHPYRYGIYTANKGRLKKDEISLAEVLKTQGYATGHFGKWHLGTLSPDYSGKGKGRNPAVNYITPAMSGFDEWFSTEYAVATWDPYNKNNIHGKGYDSRKLYWHNGVNITESLKGCDSRIIMDKAIPFIDKVAKDNKPFFAVVWFHAPHQPVVGGPEYMAQYPNQDDDHQHYYAVITALDEQIGRLRRKLRQLNVADNTMLWFCSDNGPEGNPRPTGRSQGTAGPFRGRKRSLYEGGVRVPGILEWPAKIKKNRIVKMPCVTSDYFPTCLDVLGCQLQGKPRPYDGISLLPLIEGEMTERARPIAFQSHGCATLNDNRYKLVVNGSLKRSRSDNGVSPVEMVELYDIISDPSETKNIAEKHLEIVNKMKSTLQKWQASCKESDAGKDY